MLLDYLLLLLKLSVIALYVGTYSMRLPPPQSNPLSRAVNLTLGVAVLGSLIGGVQLYGKRLCKPQRKRGVGNFSVGAGNGTAAWCSLWET